jgi:hypothetical protein
MVLSLINKAQQQLYLLRRILNKTTNKEMANEAGTSPSE